MTARPTSCPCPTPRLATLLAGAALAALLAACGGTADPSPASTPATPTGSASATAPEDSPSATSSALPTGDPRPMGHIHGIGRDPGTGAVVLATHGGLFRVDPTGPTPVGPVVDLMGFAVAGDGSYLASGHPGPGTDLPEPVGLIRSTDGGDTWEPVSRTGESDFHGLTAGADLVAGFDGALRVSTDGTTWTTRDVPSAPHVLAASPSGGRLLATTQGGLLSSSDAGRTWSRLDTPELLVVVAWADADTVVGVGVSGRLVLSEDGGRTWSVGPRAVGEVSALAATSDGSGVEVLAVIGGESVVTTSDLGATTEPLF